MSPRSRRRKKYDEQLRGFQNRNFFAVLLLLVFVGLAIWLVVSLLPGAKPTVFVSTNYIDHSGSRKIPFAEESCSSIRNAFGQHVQSKLMDAHQVDQKNSTLELPKEQLGENGVLVVYLNGHLVDDADPETGVKTVSYLGPEAKLTKKDFGEMLKQIDKSPAKLKLLFLDAGRYSWSPVYPARPLNEFSSSLAKALKENRWGELSKNFWVIVSHSDHEISQVSTPLTSSLFSRAIADSVVELSTNGNAKLNVFELFEGIRRRTTSWSRNFKNQSLQTPVLIQPGLGVVETSAEDDRLWEFAVKWKPPEKNDSNKPAQDAKPSTHSWESFAKIPGKQAGDRVTSEDYFDSAPFEAFQGLESFIELGNDLDVAVDSSYASQVGESLEKPSDSGYIRFNGDNASKKLSSARNFRRSILGMAILDRFRNEMRFWEDDAAINQLKILEKSDVRPSPVGLADFALTTREKLPSTLGQYASDFQDFRRQHSGLVGIVRQSLKRSILNTTDRYTLTPTQAELLGRTSKRYLPLIASFEPVVEPDEDDKKIDRSDAGSGTNVFSLDMSVEASTSKFGTADGLSVSDLHEAAVGAITKFNGPKVSDTQYRYALSSGGSEAIAQILKLGPRTGIVPRINWSPVKPKITFDSPTRRVRINPFEMDPVTLGISAQAVETVQLDVEVDGEPVPGLIYGLSSQLRPTQSITFEDGDMATMRAKPFQFFMRHRTPENYFGKPIDLKVTASCPDNDKVKPAELLITVQLTRDPTVQLIARRKWGEGESPETGAPLIRWGGQLPSNWTPLTINSLANVRSTFDFSLVNNSSAAKTLRGEIFNVVDLPLDFGSTQVHADRPDATQVQELSSWLFKQQRDPGATSLEESNRQRLLKIAQTLPVEVPPGGQRKPVTFSVPLVGEKQEPTEDSLREKTVPKGMIVVFYEDGAEAPGWFQWLAFEPIEPADAGIEKGGQWLKPLPDILDVFQENPDIENKRQRNQTETILTKNWVPAGTKDDPGPAAKLITISDEAYAKNREFLNQLKLKNIFQGQSLVPKSRDRDALLILELLGVPNYAIFELSRGTISQASFRDRLTGVRVAKLPGDGWECHPKTWSLFGSSKIISIGDDSQERVIYLRRPEGGASGDLELELLLPVDSSFEVLGSGANDFELLWRDGNPELRYQNSRRHVAQASTSGLSVSPASKPSVPMRTKFAPAAKATPRA
jgi:hypothetical protein